MVMSSLGNDLTPTHRRPFISDVVLIIHENALSRDLRAILVISIETVSIFFSASLAASDLFTDRVRCVRVAPSDRRRVVNHSREQRANTHISTLWGILLMSRSTAAHICITLCVPKALVENAVNHSTIRILVRTRR